MNDGVNSYVENYFVDCRSMDIPTQLAMLYLYRVCADEDTVL